MKFTRDHASSLIKYTGISFITGAISHGFFSEVRSLLMGAFGVVCFIVGTLMEDGYSTKKAILLSAGLAIAIGAVTGGLQHFPDSPERSLLIIPVGYVLSLALFAYLHEHKITSKDKTYMVLSSLFILVLSVGIFLFIENGDFFGHAH